MQTEITGLVGPVQIADGGGRVYRQGRTGEQLVTQLHGRYYEQASRGNLYIAHAIVTAPVIYTTAAGTGGPLIWNPPGSGVNVALLAATVGVTTVTTVAAALGITGNQGQSAAPGSTTAIDSQFAGLVGSGLGKAKAYRVGTVSVAGGFFLPFAQLHTGALTVDNLGCGWVDLGGCVVIPPGAWASIAASATASTTVAQLGLVYEEVPV